jgi:tetratricopeptide (TPR) repeat protein
VAILSLAGHYQNLNRRPDALKLLGAVWERQRDRLGPDHADTLATRMSLAECYLENNQPAESLKQVKEILTLLAERKAPLERGHVVLLRTMAGAGCVVQQPEEGPRLLEQILEIQKARLPQDHPDALEIMSYVATSYVSFQRGADAVKLLRDVLKIQKVKPGRDDPEMIGTMLQLATLHLNLQQYDDALELCQEVQEVLAILKAKAGPVDDATRAIVSTASHLADQLDAAGRLLDGLKLREGLLALWKSKFPANEPEPHVIMHRLADSYTNLGRHADALKLREEALKVEIARFTGDPHETILRTQSVWYEAVPILEMMTGVADSYTAANRHAEAEQRYDQALELYKALIDKMSEDRQRLPHVRNLAASTAAKLGTVQLLGTRKVNEAEARFAEAVRLDERATVSFTIGDTYARNGQWKKAAAAYDRGLGMDPSNLQSWHRTAALHLGAGDAEGYRRVCREMLDRYCARQKIHLIDEERTATACSLAPGAVADFGVVETLAQRAVTGTEKHAYYPVFAWSKGLAEYRAGRFAGAVEWLKRFGSKDDASSYDATAFAALAMARHRVGEAEEAKASLVKAKAIVAGKMPDPAKGRPFEQGDWQDWLHAQILIREAEGVLKEKAGDKKPELKKPD